MELTNGTLLGGRVIYRQPRDGYRTGIEPVLLAASVTALPGECVLEAGTGAGAGLLCLLGRVAGLTVSGIERDAAMAALAQENVRANGWEADIIAADLRQSSPGRDFDHAMANPPWHGEHSTPSVVARRDAAKRARTGLLTEWASALAHRVRPGGSVTFIVPAASLPEAAAGLAEAGCGSLALLPLWPRQAQDAKLVLLRALKGRRDPCRILPGLLLHKGNGYTAEARAILWDAAPITWAA